MSSMPGMEDDEEKPKKKGVDLAIIMGGGKPKDGLKMPPKDDSASDEELPHGFEEACQEAFPDMTDPEQMHALKRLIMLCTDSY